MTSNRVIDKQFMQTTFKDQANAWIRSAYGEDGISFPVAKHRARLVLQILAEENKPLAVADLGCGGGHLAALLAEAGHTITGIDQSEKMIEIACARQQKLGTLARKRVTFVNAELEHQYLKKASMDCVVSMGVIGYLPDDDLLFSQAKQLLKPGGLFLVSCRNRLFNMSSLTHRTLREIENGTAGVLLGEIDSLYRTIDEDAVSDFVNTLVTITTALAGSPPSTALDLQQNTDNSITNTDSAVEARQHTPTELNATAARYGMTEQAVYGVHPHIMDPRLAGLLPKGFFDKLCEAMTAFEGESAVLPVCSVFLSVYRRQD